MAKRKLDPCTLRWVVRKLRSASRKRELAPILASFDNAWADAFLTEARTIERKAKKARVT